MPGKQCLPYSCVLEIKSSNIVPQDSAGAEGCQPKALKIKYPKRDGGRRLFSCTLVLAAN